MGDDVLYYLIGDGAGVAGWSFGDLRARLGSGGIYMNTKDLARFQAFLNNSETLPTTQERAAMYVNYLGWADVNPQTNPILGSQGTYYSKQGSFQNNTGQGVRTIIMTYPKNKVEAVFRLIHEVGIWTTQMNLISCSEMPTTMLGIKK